MIRSLLVAAVLALAAAGSAQAAPAVSKQLCKSVATPGCSTPISAHSAGSSGIVATMAGLGSFEWVEAPSYTRLIVAVNGATHAFKAGSIDVTVRAKAVTQAKDVLATLDLARTTCAQDDHSGKCTGDSVKADYLLAQANAKMNVAPLVYFVPLDLRKK